jgi:hypothetical protein
LAQRLPEDTDNYSMHKLFCFVTLVIALMPCAAQDDIKGVWRSSASQRSILVRERVSGQYECVILSDEKDSSVIGFLLVRNLRFNHKRKLYNGVIYSPKHPEIVTSVTIKADPENRELTMVLQRMIFMHIRMHWERQPAKSIVTDQTHKD